MNWEFGTSRCQLLFIGWINYKFLKYSTENYIQYLMINHNRKEYKKRMYTYICVYIYITESLCYTAEIKTTL